MTKIFMFFAKLDWTIARSYANDIQ